MADERSLICLECNRAVANTNNVLARHVRSMHGIEWPEYVVKHEHGGQWPKCICGCGEKLVWRKGGFGKYLMGHDRPSSQSIDVHQGWVVNPFTGREELIRSEVEAELLQHLVSTGDAATRDHGIKISWTDGSGNMRVEEPSFKLLNSNAVIIIDDFKDMDGGRRWVAIKAWASKLGVDVIILRRMLDGSFNVIGRHLCSHSLREQGVSDGSKQEKG